MQTTTDGFAWRVYHAPRNKAAKHVGSVTAACRTDAEAMARAYFPQIKKAVQVISEASWRHLSTMERRCFLGLFTDEDVKAREAPPGRRERVRPLRIVSEDVRETDCVVCQRPLRFRKPPTVAVWRQPPKYHNECAPRMVRHDRAYRMRHFPETTIEILRAP